MGVCVCIWGGGGGVISCDKKLCACCKHWNCSVNVFPKTACYAVIYYSTAETIHVEMFSMTFKVLFKH